jgi:penicillin-binding protein 1C
VKAVAVGALEQHPANREHFGVTSANAGVHNHHSRRDFLRRCSRIPAFAGMTIQRGGSAHSDDFGRGTQRRWGFAIGALALGIGLFSWGYWSATLIAPAPTPLLLDRHGEFLAQVASPGGEGYGYWPIEQLPPRVVAATLSLEDRRFWAHPGVDPIAIGRALWQNVASGERVSGASTLAMQVARMQDPGPRTYYRKATEAVAALFMTFRYGREAILSQYLRLVPYGNDVHGIAYAARLYFDKPVADLSWAEIAFLAAIPQAPSRMNPLSPTQRDFAIARGHRILAALRDDDVLAPPEFALAEAQLDALPPVERTVRPGNALHAILNLQDSLAADDGWRRGRGDLRVVTTIDLNVQNRIARLAARSLARWQGDGAQQVAVIVTRTSSREVLAWLGSADYFRSPSGALDFALAERSPGSTLKPFIYALALDRGDIAADTPLVDSATDAGAVENADHGYLGRLLPRQALANSRNVPAVGLVRTIGIDETYLYLRLLGLHDEDRPARYFGLPMAIGGLPTSLAKIVRAYGALANDGVVGDLVWYRGQPTVPPRRLMSAATARLVTLFISDPMARLPSFPRMSAVEYPFPVAVKTGTSQGYRDAWTIAYSRDYLVGVWIGRPDAGAMRNVGGSSSAARLARAILLDLQGGAVDQAALAFPAPEGRVAREICTGTGQVAGGSCEGALREWLPIPAALVQPQPMLTTNPQESTVQLAITTPQDSTHIIRNPETPADLASLALTASVTPTPPQLLWYVDGQPYRLATAAESVRWPLQAGLHRFQVRIPNRGIASAIVTVQVD